MTNQIDIYITFNKLSQTLPYGLYDIDKNTYQLIKLKLGKSSNIYTKNIYYNRNSIIEEIDNNYNIYQQNQHNFMISNTSIIIMSSIKQLDVNDVPILSKYNNQEKINISEYNKNGYTILLEECNNKYYIHIKLNDDNNLSYKIKQIEELFI
jgi:hypothetical protein